MLIKQKYSRLYKRKTYAAVVKDNKREEARYRQRERKNTIRKDMGDRARARHQQESFLQIQKRKEKKELEEGQMRSEEKHRERQNRENKKKD